MPSLRSNVGTARVSPDPPQVEGPGKGRGLPRPIATAFKAGGTRPQSRERTRLTAVPREV
jgi:hypothetical protein